MGRHESRAQSHQHVAKKLIGPILQCPECARGHSMKQNTAQNTGTSSGFFTKSSGRKWHCMQKHCTDVEMHGQKVSQQLKRSTKHSLSTTKHRYGNCIIISQFDEARKNVKLKNNENLNLHAYYTNQPTPVTLFTDSTTQTSHSLAME